MMIGQAARDICIVVSVVGIWSLAGTYVAVRIAKLNDQRKATTIVALERLHTAITSSARASQQRHEALMDYIEETHKAIVRLINDALERCNGQ